MNVQTSSAKRFTNKGIVSFMLIAGMFAASFSAAVVSWNPIYAQTTAPIEEEVEDEGMDGAEDEMDEEEELETEGTVDAMPADGAAGTWVIGGQSYIADANTEFEVEEGAAPLQVGDCAEVEYELSGSENLALEIEACEEEELEVEGTVDAMPADGGAGTWVIDGQSYIADANTEFEVEEGATPLQVGDCAEVEYELSGSDNLALEIEACEDESAEMEEEDADEVEDADETEDADTGTETGTETGTTPPAGSASNGTTNILTRAPNLFFLPMVNS